MKRSHQDIETLKAQWVRDPIWDLEDAEGFEEHHAELKAYSDTMKAEWAAKRKSRLEKIKASNGVPLTPLDYMASAAMQGIMAAGGTGHLSSAHIASNAYAIACAMMFHRVEEGFVTPAQREVDF